MIDFGSQIPYALGGGVLIGLASFIASAATGKIPGISGVVGRLLKTVTGDRWWRVVFLVGLIAGAGIGFAVSDAAASYRPMRALPVIGIGALLVGIGTRLGGGCTSGHGVCGMGLGAKDSLVATLIFMASAALTVLIFRP